MVALINLNGVQVVAPIYSAKPSSKDLSVQSALRNKHEGIAGVECTKLRVGLREGVYKNKKPRIRAAIVVNPYVTSDVCFIHSLVFISSPFTTS